MSKRTKLVVLLMLVSGLAIAAGVPTIMRTDRIKLGLPASTDDKVVEFDTADGASNVKLSITNALGVTLNSDDVQMGDGTASDKEIRFNRGGSNPFIRWNETEDKLQFSENGTDIKNFGSGAGGGSGINVLSEFNFDFESGSPPSQWTASAGTFIAETTNELFGTKSGSWDASLAADTLTSASVPIPIGLRGANCSASIYYKYDSGLGTDYTLQFLDGSNVVLASTDLPLTTTTGASQKTVSAPCPGTGNIKLRILANANGGVILLDNAHLGSLNALADLSQATLVGTAYFETTGSCSWSRTNTALGAFGTTAACPGPTVESNAGPGLIQTTDTNLPQVTVNNLPPGQYAVVWSASSTHTSGGSGHTITLALNDGTTTSGRATSIATGVSAPRFSQTVVGQFNYTVSGNRTFSLFGATSSGDVIVDNDANLIRNYFAIYKYPSAGEAAFRPDQVAWRVDANISGANPDLGGADEATYRDIPNASLSLTQNTGSISTFISCSGTEESSGATCAGTEDIGISFVAPTAGEVLACASFSHYAEPGTTAGNEINTAFQIVETPNALQTISQQGKSRISDHTFASTNGSAFLAVHPFRVCGTFVFSSAGKKTLRLFYEQNISGTISTNLIHADGSAAVGQRDIHWEVYPINQYVPAPLLVNSIVSKSAGIERLDRASVDDSGACSSSPCTIEAQSGFLTSITRSATGVYSLNFNTAYSGIPACVCSSNISASHLCTVNTVTTTTAQLQTVVSDTALAVDSAFQVLCMGPR